MGQRSNSINALLMDAQVKSSREECAGSMGQNANDAAVMDAQILLSKEEFAGDMVQRKNRNDAALKGAQIKLR